MEDKQKRHPFQEPRRSSLYVKRVGLDGPVVFSLYEVHDALERDNLIAMLSGPGDDGNYRQIFTTLAYRKLLPEEIERLSALIKLGDAYEEIGDCDHPCCQDQDQD